MPAAWDQSQT